MITPLVTVAMVTYNSAKYLSEAIESVLSQSYNNLELVICDDCSIDNTWEIINSYKDTRIRAYRNATNLREYPNRNQALQLAKGDFLIFIDGDDILYPHGLEFMVRMLHAFPDSVAAICRPWYEKMLFPAELNSREIYLFEYLGKGIIGINFTQILFRTKELLKIGGFDSKYRTGDTHIQLKLALQNKFLIINEGNAWWRRTEGQASEIVLKGVVGVIESTKYRLGFLNDHKCPLSEAEKQVSYKNLFGIYYRTAFRYLLKGKIVDSFKLFSAFTVTFKNIKYLFQKADFTYPKATDNSINFPITSGLNNSPYYNSEYKSNS